jgi:hypothetical protein
MNFFCECSGIIRLTLKAVYQLESQNRIIDTCHRISPLPVLGRQKRSDNYEAKSRRVFGLFSTSD